MAERTLQAKLKVRSDTATNWQSNNPVLLQGEPALETDTNKLKFGDGTSAYNDLSYISGGAVTVEANPTEEATQTLQKLRVENNVYSIPQGTEVIDLGEVTLIEQNVGAVKASFADGIPVSAEQATQAQAASPCIAKVVINGATHEFIRINISSDASAAYVVFTATEDNGGESICFYRLQISIPLTGGTASASLFVFEYTILGGLNSAYKAGGLTFADGVATKTLTEEEVGEWGYNQIRFSDNAHSSEQYTLYLSHANTGASLIDSHNYDYFGIVENASVTGEAGGITAFAAYLEGTTLTIERITIGGSGVPFVDLGTVTLTQSGTDETVKTGTVSITSEQLSQMTGSVPAVVKFTISGSGSLQISLSERVGDASSPSVVAYVGAFQNGTNTIKSYLVNVSGSSATIQEVTLYTVTPNSGTGGTPLTSLKIGATTYSIPQGSEIVDLGSVTATEGQGTPVTITSEQWNKIASAQHPKIKLQMLNTAIDANESLPLELDYVTTLGDAQISVIQYQKVALWEAASSGLHQLVTAMLAIIDNNNTITAQFYWYTSLINNGIPAGGLAGQALTKQSGTDYDVAWTSINTSEPTVMTEAAYAEALAAGTIENDKLYYIQGTSDNTLNVSQTAQATTYNNATSGLTATNVQAAIDELKENEFSGSYNDLTDKPTIPTTLAELSEKSYNDLTDKPTIPTTLAQLSERSYNSLTDKPKIPTNGDFTLAGLSEKSYNSLTDKPTIPTLDVASIAMALGLTTTQLNNLITLSKSITSASSSEVVISGTLTASSFNTNA